MTQIKLQNKEKLVNYLIETLDDCVNAGEILKKNLLEKGYCSLRDFVFKDTTILEDEDISVEWKPKRFEVDESYLELLRNSKTVEEDDRVPFIKYKNGQLIIDLEDLNCLGNEEDYNVLKTLNKLRDLCFNND